MLPLPLLLAPAGAQALVMAVDEGYCHRARGLGAWERWGHPIDTLTVAAAYAWLSFSKPTEPNALPVYAGLALLSCLVITKDEVVHAKACDALEGWLHAVLFVLHPVVFLGFGILFQSGSYGWIIRGQLALTLAFAAYQFLYWRFAWSSHETTSPG